MYKKLLKDFVKNKNSEGKTIKEVDVTSSIDFSARADNVTGIKAIVLFENMLLNGNIG